MSPYALYVTISLANDCKQLFVVALQCVPLLRFTPKYLSLISSKVSSTCSLELMAGTSNGAALSSNLFLLSGWTDRTSFYPPRWHSRKVYFRPHTKIWHVWDIYLWESSHLADDHSLINFPDNFQQIHIKVRAKDRSGNISVHISVSVFFSMISVSLFLEFSFFPLSFLPNTSLTARAFPLFALFFICRPPNCLRACFSAITPRPSCIHRQFPNHFHFCVFSWLSETIFLYNSKIHFTFRSV